MATLTVECKRGPVTIESADGETSEQVAARLAEAVKAAGGRKGERIEKPRPVTRHDQMDRWALIECSRCSMWLPPTKFAAERHDRKYHAAEAAPTLRAV